MSAKKVTMADIAKEARVGIATVDRVLNKRTPVKESTERKVLESARRLGFALEQSRYRLAADRPAVALRMGFILLQQSHSFYHQLAQARTLRLFCITILTPSTIWPPRSPV